MAKIGIENLQDNVVALLNKSEDLTQLETNHKDSLVGAINEIIDFNLITDKNNRKLLADTLGLPITEDKSIGETCNMLLEMLDDFRTTLRTLGSSVTDTESLMSCILKVKDLQTFKIVSGDSTTLYSIPTQDEFQQSNNYRVIGTYNNDKYNGILKTTYTVKLYYPVKYKVTVMRGGSVVEEKEMKSTSSGSLKNETKSVDINVKKGDIITFSTANDSTNGWSSAQYVTSLKLTCDIVF